MVFETIRKLLADQLDIDEDEITMDSTLLEDLGADSIELVDLVMSIEEEYGIEVPDDATDDIRTVGDAVRYVENLVD
ncbi:MAG: acyl carrier protein [Clostridia bacterium]|nr:acyl carrier protein [Clostridia bacterium]MBQ8469946.1 acyl carrier protein [Clostridia bacterium]MBR1704928.1 acyl carrier protein [Clostridia bacterium]